MNYSKKIDLIKSIETDCPGLLFNGNFINGISLENNILNSLEIAKKYMKNNIDLKVRPRRLRNSKILRSLVSETKLDLDDLVYPLFIKFGKKIKIEIDSMPGVYQFSKDTVLNEIEELLKLKN